MITTISTITNSARIENMGKSTSVKASQVVKPCTALRDMTMRTAT